MANLLTLRINSRHVLQNVLVSGTARGSVCEERMEFVINVPPSRESSVLSIKFNSIKSSLFVLLYYYIRTQALKSPFKIKRIYFD